MPNDYNRERADEIGDAPGAIIGSLCGMAMIACLFWMAYFASEMLKAAN